MEQIVIDSNDYKLAYSFAYGVKGASIKELEDMVVASNDINFIFLFAKNVEGANKVRLRNILIEMGIPSFILKYSIQIEYISYDIIKTIDFGSPIANSTMHNETSYKTYIKTQKAKLVS